MRPCLGYTNVLMKNASVLETLGDAYVDISCHEPHRFKVQTSYEFAVSCEKVRGADALWRAGQMTQGMYKQIAMAEGLNFNPLGAPWDSDLSRHVDVYGAVVMDWVHNALQGGTMNVECMLVLEATGETNLWYKSVETFLKRADWKFPKKRRSQCKGLHRVFSEWRTNSDGEMDKIRCNASELLSLYGLLRNFVRTEIDNGRADIQPTLDSFFCLLQSH